MGNPTFQDIQEYGKYLLAQGNKPEDEKAYTDYLANHHGVQTNQDAMGVGEAARVKGEEGVLLGLRPVVAGIGGAIGKGYASLTAPDQGGGQGYNLKRALSEAGKGFVEGRQDANQEQNQASTDHPYVGGAANLAGSLVSLPFLPGKGLAGAVGLGAGLGAAQAAGSANSLGEAAKDVGTGAAVGGVAYGAAKAIGSGLSSLADSEIGQTVGQKAKSLGKKILVGTPSELTGVPDKEIEAYATRADKVNKIIQDSGGDMSLAAKHAKENILSDVVRTKNSLNQQISDALANSSQEKNISIAPIMDKIEQYKSKINPKLYPESLAQINELKNRILSVAGNYGGERTAGMISPQELQEIKGFLYDSASPAYGSTQLGFKVGGEAANAAKSGGRAAKELMDKFGPIEIKNANRQLAQLHEIEDSMGRNLLNPEGPHGALWAVGAGVDNANSHALKNLGDLTGKNYMQDLNDLSAARTFNDTPLMPSIKTGRALLGPAVGASIGGSGGAIFGGAPGAYIGAKVGAGIGAIVSSPAALKLAIDTGRLSGKAISAVADAFGANPQNFAQVYEMLQNPQAQEILIRALSQDNNQAAAKERLSTTIKPRSSFK